jgi:cytochrome c biogenesis protein CcmG, thiol:disulfide interchange protein DsbE
MRPVRLSWALGGGAALVLMASLGWGLVHAAKPAPRTLVGQAAPDLAIQPLLDGPEVRLANLRGKPVVLNFWASWCVPCRTEAPVLNAAAHRYQGRVQFLGADIQDSDQPRRAFLTQYQVQYPAGPIVRGSYHDFGVTAPPETYFIDRQGVVVLRVTGEVDASGLRTYLGLLQP